MATGEDVYCTLVLTDAYLPGAAVLAHSLRDAGTQKKLVCMVSQDTLRPSTIVELQSLYNHVIPIDRIGNPNPANLYLMNRPDLLYTFSKINLWRLTQFRKVVYIDADVVALRAPDELFKLDEDFAAAPDVGWPDAFNTGVMLLAPHMGEYWALRALASAGDSFDGADQGLLNQYYEHKPWKRLSFTYNCTPSANYQYEPAYRHYKHGISMVHFIGRDKPWLRGRARTGAPPGAYQELLGRWWAVYDRHFRISTHDYIATGQREYQSNVVPREVNGSAKREETGYYASGYPVESTEPAPPPEAPVTTTTTTTTTIDAPLTDRKPPVPAPPAEQHPFSAPHMDWDATRSAPPAVSKPEAPNFPSTNYEFNTDPQPFRPPASYPAPPKDMWYDVPKPQPKEEKLPPIFPWEERAVQKPARVFVEDAPRPDPPRPDPLEIAGMDELEVRADDRPAPPTPTIRVTPDAPWHDFRAANKNAWDEVGGIEDYVRALTAFQKTRGQVQVLPPEPAAVPPVPGPPTVSSTQPGVLSPTAEVDPVGLVATVRARRESLLLTDFPTAVERPSLPVTPAPRRRPTFWGEARDDGGELASAEGVPEQSDWDPSEQLEQLRRNSLIGPGDLKLPARRELPRRDMPAHAALVPEAVVEDGAATVTTDGSRGVATASSASGSVEGDVAPSSSASELMSRSVEGDAASSSTGVEAVERLSGSSRSKVVEDASFAPRPAEQLEASPGLAGEARSQASSGSGTVDPFRVSSTAEAEAEERHETISGTGATEREASSSRSETAPQLSASSGFTAAGRDRASSIVDSAEHVETSSSAEDTRQREASAGLQAGGREETEGTAGSASSALGLLSRSEEEEDTSSFAEATSERETSASSRAGLLSSARESTAASAFPRSGARDETSFWSERTPGHEPSSLAPSHAREETSSFSDRRTSGPETEEEGGFGLLSHARAGDAPSSFAEGRGGADVSSFTDHVGRNETSFIDNVGRDETSFFSRTSTGGGRAASDFFSSSSTGGSAGMSSSSFSGGAGRNDETSNFFPPAGRKEMSSFSGGTASNNETADFFSTGGREEMSSFSGGREEMSSFSGGMSGDETSSFSRPGLLSPFGGRDGATSSAETFGRDEMSGLSRAGASDGASGFTRTGGGNEMSGFFRTAGGSGGAEMSSFSETSTSTQTFSSSSTSAAWSHETSSATGLIEKTELPRVLDFSGGRVNPSSLGGGAENEGGDGEGE